VASPFHGSHANATRELFALRIIEIAQLGERDPNRLRDDALLYFDTNEPQEQWSLAIRACPAPIHPACGSHQEATTKMLSAPLLAAQLLGAARELTISNK
jgi:hypothetical protein